MSVWYIYLSFLNIAAALNETPGYQLIVNAKKMPAELQYLRAGLNMEKFRLLDWAHVVKIKMQDDSLLIDNKPLVLDVLDQLNKALQQFGRVDKNYRELQNPLLIDGPPATAVLDTPPYSPTEPTSPRISGVDSEFQSRFPQSDALLRDSLDWVKKTGTFPKQLAWANWDTTKVEDLIFKLSAVNDFMHKMLKDNQIQTLTSRQTRTWFQIIQLNGTTKQLVEIFEFVSKLKTRRIFTESSQGLFQAHGCYGEEKDVEPE